MGKVTDFHKKRIMFYMWDGEMIVAPENDPRGHKEFINNDEIFNTCIRGYYMDHKLVFYTDGNEFNLISLHELPKAVHMAITTLKTTVGTSIYNGVKRGKPGDVWELKNSLGR